jgi:hypothetical protein
LAPRAGLVRLGHEVGWEQGLCKVLLPSPMPQMSNPVCPVPLLWPVAPPPVYAYLCMFIFLLILFWGSGGGLQWLPMADSFGCVPAHFMDCLSCGRHHHCAWEVQWDRQVSLCMHPPVCFPSSPCWGGVRVCVWHGGRPMLVLTPAGSAP